MFHLQHTHLCPTCPNRFLHSMYLEPISANSLIQTAHKLKPKLSSGHDDIPTKVLKEIMDIVCSPLSHVINLSFSTGIVPDNFKIAKVVPIYKSSDNMSLNNYRPISLLP